jgi:hypothetical protein
MAVRTTTTTGYRTQTTNAPRHPVISRAAPIATEMVSPTTRTTAPSNPAHEKMAGARLIQMMAEEGMEETEEMAEMAEMAGMATINHRGKRSLRL